ncbi:MAG: hypothetical protein IKE33_03920 [Erysipelotrichaceae bacterium]|nr:hypothetical protein [Erysipelotrichaceae bacterium]
MKNKLIKFLVLFVLTALLLYTFTPALNLKSKGFYVLLIFLCIVYMVMNLDLRKVAVENDAKKLFKYTIGGVDLKIAFGIIVLSLILILGSSIVFSPLFNAKAHANRINIVVTDFTEVPEYEFGKTAIIDRKSSVLLGDKTMGQMVDLVSQYNVSEEYSQVDYQGGTYRVSPLAHASFIKFLKNKTVPGYVIVNTTTGVARFVEVEMKYTNSAYFNDNLMRKLFFSYPTKIFGEPTFEIDEEGHPYYIATTYTYKGIGDIKMVEGAVILDPCDGSSTYYKVEDLPTWVDRIYPEYLVTEELNENGLYSNGFFNSKIGQQGVTQVSEGYNYISKEGDIWLYTGLTSIVSDESNIGFYLVNLRTHEAQKILISASTEYAAMESVEGEVLNYGYTSTFPTLINVNNKPIYLTSLKDSAGLVKMYAVLDAQDYQQVYVEKADRNTEEILLNLISNLSDVSHIDSDLTEEKTLRIQEIDKVMIDGDTYYYLKADDQIYTIKATQNNAPSIVFLKAGDVIDVKLNGNVILEIK